MGDAADRAEGQGGAQVRRRELQAVCGQDDGDGVHQAVNAHASVFRDGAPCNRCCLSSHSELVLRHHLGQLLQFGRPWSQRMPTLLQQGFFRLGGHAIYLGPDTIQFGKREATKDIARVLAGCAGASCAAHSGAGCNFDLTGHV